MKHTIELHTGVADYTVSIYSERYTSRSRPVYSWFISLDGRSFASSMAFTYDLNESLASLRSYVHDHFGSLVASQLSTEFPEGF